MSRAFEQVQRYTLTEDEVEVVYLALTRLREIEKAGERRDLAEIQALLGWDTPVLPNTEQGGPSASVAGSND